MDYDWYKYGNFMQFTLDCSAGIANCFFSQAKVFGTQCDTFRACPSLNFTDFLQNYLT